MATRRWGEFLLHLRRGPTRSAGPAPTDGALLRRFVDDRDEAAFAHLVQRHGPMVFGVCCRILCPGPDAEDAFQATFVVLARRAAALADRAVVGNWLFGVARRTALKARLVAARRRAKEQEMARPVSQPLAHPEELREVIDAAVADLPTKYRVPVVLCELEGRSLREAAAELGWPEGTVAGRLSRGRALLRARLARAGLPATAAVALAIPVPSALAAAAVGVGCAAGGGAGVVPPAVAVLAAQVQRQMALIRIMPITVGLGVALAAAGAITMTRGDPEPTPLVAVPAADGLEVPRRPAVDAFGDPLPAGAVARLGTGRLRHGGRLGALAFTADGTGLVGAGDQWANQVWDVGSGRHRFTVTADRIASSAIALARDGSRFAASPDEKHCVVWDAATGKEIRRLTLPRAPGQAMAVTPDSRVAVSTGNKVIVYASDGAVARELATPGEPAALVFSADGTRLAANFEGSTLVFEVGTGTVLNHLRTGTNTSFAAAFSPNGDALVVAPSGIYVFDLPSGTQARWFGPTATALAMAPDGNLLATVDVEGRVQLWNWRTGVLVRDIVTDRGTRALAFAPDGATLAIGGAWQTVRLFDTVTGHERHPGSAPPAGTFNLGLSRDGRRLITSAFNGLQVWDPVSGQRVVRLEPADPLPFILAVTPDGTRVAGYGGNRVRVWDPVSGRELCECDGPHGYIWALGFAQNGTALVGAYSAELRVWDAATGKTRDVLTRPKVEPRSIGVGGSGPELSVGYHDGSVAIWDLAASRVSRLAGAKASEEGGALGVAYDAGREVLAVVTPGRVRVHDAETMAERWSIPRPQPPGPLWSPVALSADGRRLAYADGPTIHVVDLETGTVVRTFRGHSAAVTGLAFAPDSDRLYSASLDTTVLVWDVGSPAP